MRDRGRYEAGYIVTPATEAMKSCFFAGVVAVQ
jgi:hypothetical protein